MPQAVDPNELVNILSSLRRATEEHQERLRFAQRQARKGAVALEESAATEVERLLADIARDLEGEIGRLRRG